jgi:hypothetical protein
LPEGWRSHCRNANLAPWPEQRPTTPRYWERILPRLDPGVVVPTHYDDFFAPLGRRQAFVRRVNLAGVSAEVSAVSRDARLAALPRVDSGPAAIGRRAPAQAPAQVDR